MKRDRPDLPPWGYDFAMRQAERLKLAYPKGLTGRDVGREFGLSRKSGVNAMNKRGFYAFDGRYRWEDVAAMLTMRQYRRMKELDELLGRNK